MPNKNKGVVLCLLDWYLLCITLGIAGELQGDSKKKVTHPWEWCYCTQLRNSNAHVGRLSESLFVKILVVDSDRLGIAHLQVGSCQAWLQCC